VDVELVVDKLVVVGSVNTVQQVVKVCDVPGATASATALPTAV
jgi:hypothetical protein